MFLHKGWFEQSAADSCEQVAMLFTCPFVMLFVVMQHSGC